MLYTNDVTYSLSGLNNVGNNIYIKGQQKLNNFEK